MGWGGGGPSSLLPHPARGLDPGEGRPARLRRDTSHSLHPLGPAGLGSECARCRSSEASKSLGAAPGREAASPRGGRRSAPRRTPGWGGGTHDGHAGFAQVAVLLLQRLALEFVGLQLDLEHLVLLLQRGQAVGELFQAERRDDNAPRLPTAAASTAATAAAAARGRRARRLHGGRATAVAPRPVRVALAGAVRHGRGGLGRRGGGGAGRRRRRGLGCE